MSLTHYQKHCYVYVTTMTGGSRLHPEESSPPLNSTLVVT